MKNDKQDIKKEIEELRKKIFQADKAYYIDSSPEMSDLEYDRFFNKLLSLEEQNPEFDDTSSPTKRIGSDIDNVLPEKEHTIPILSLDKCYSINDLLDWIAKNKEKLDDFIEIVIEPKIDGAGVVLYYENGKLDRALTRGNGYVGNDITENIKTIRSVPLIIDYNETLAVRGEVYIKNNDFKIFNDKYAEGKYSNPRNLASGSVRRQKSKEVKLFPLNLICYEGFYEKNIIKTHLESLISLKKLGFPVNSNVGFFTDSKDKIKDFYFKDGVLGRIEDIPEYIEKLKSERKNISYDIDGLVAKINNLDDRDKLGFTQHHPRWAIAFKFNAPLAETKVLSIDVQIGRGGRSTPVANLEPVKLAGSVISRATLHNQDYIDSLNVNAGDTVTISKRGDVIPAVEEVVEKGENVSSFKIGKICPSCSSELVQDGAHLFCKNEKCQSRMLETLIYFVSRDQMDIETLGEKTIEFLFTNGFIKSIPDIYTFDYNKLLEFEGFKDKKINNIIDALEKSKSKDFKTVLYSLGLKDIGSKTSELLVNRFKNVDAIISTAKEKRIEKFVEIDGIGEIIARSIISHFKNPKVLKMINDLKKIGLKFEIVNSNENIEEQFLAGTKWVITGSFVNFKPREKAEELIKKFGGDVLSAVTSKTSYLLAGSDPGSKLDKARKLGIKILNEDEFLKIINKK